jgi:WD40 repeat protein
MFRLGPSGMAVLARTCRRMNEAAHDQALWRDLCRARWPFVSVDQYRNWRTCYKAHTAIRHGWDAGRAGDFKVATFRGHTDYITAFQLYRSHLVTASADRTARVWRASLGGEEEPTSRVIEGHEGPVRCVQFTEAMLVTGSDDATARAWDTATGIELHLMRSTARVSALRFDDTMCFVGSANGQVKQWDQKTGVAVRTMTGHTAPISGIWFDDRDLYTCAPDGVRVYDIRSGACRTSMATPALCF